jgi:hypothetical protein
MRPKTSFNIRFTIANDESMSFSKLSKKYNMSPRSIVKFKKEFDMYAVKISKYPPERGERKRRSTIPGGIVLSIAEWVERLRESKKSDFSLNKICLTPPNSLIILDH